MRVVPVHHGKSRWVVAALLGCGVAAGADRVFADAVSHAPGNLRAASSSSMKAGPGGVCARAEVSQQGDPAPGAGQLCNDQAMIGIVGGIQEPIMSANDVFNVGNARNRAYGGGGVGGLPAGRPLEYHRTERNDKVAEAKLAANGSITIATSASKTIQNTTTKANATQTVTTLGNIGRIRGLATSSITGALPRAGFGVAFVNDPVLIERDSLSSDGVVDLFIGDDETGDFLSLQASEPGDFALALYELAIDDEPIVSFTMGIDHATKSLDDLELTFSGYNAGALGFPNGTAWFTSEIRPYLNEFDFSQHLLTAESQIPLFSFELEEIGDSALVTYNYAAIVGSSIPEPSSLTLFATGSLMAAGLRRRRTRV